MQRTKLFFDKFRMTADAFYEIFNTISKRLMMRKLLKKYFRITLLLLLFGCELALSQNQFMKRAFPLRGSARFVMRPKEEFSL